MRRSPGCPCGLVHRERCEVRPARALGHSLRSCASGWVSTSLWAAQRRPRGMGESPSMTRRVSWVLREIRANPGARSAHGTKARTVLAGEASKNHSSTHPHTRAPHLSCPCCEDVAGRSAGAGAQPSSKSRGACGVGTLGVTKGFRSPPSSGFIQTTSVHCSSRFHQKGTRSRKYDRHSARGVTWSHADRHSHRGEPRPLVYRLTAP